MSKNLFEHFRDESWLTCLWPNDLPGLVRSALKQSTLNRQVRDAVSAGLVARTELTPGGALLVRATKRGRSEVAGDVRMYASAALRGLSTVPGDCPATFVPHFEGCAAVMAVDYRGASKPS